MNKDPMSASVGPVESEQQFVVPHADKEVVIMGIRGTIGGLFKLCPVPHDQMTQEQVDAYVEKLIAQDENPENKPEDQAESEEEAVTSVVPEASEAKKKLN